MRVDFGTFPSPTPPGRSPLAERPARTFSAVLEPGGRPAGPRVAAPPATGASPLAAVLARAADADRATDALIAAAARGRTFTPAQLLALQATVSRGTQTIEVVSRAVDRLVATVKQSLGTQV